MRENYVLVVKGGQLDFASAERDFLDELNASLGFLDGEGPICRMGDPELMSCSVYRAGQEVGGVFVVFDANGPLFAAQALTGLTYGMGMGFFGKMVAEARYGVDIYESGEVDD